MSAEGPQGPAERVALWLFPSGRTGEDLLIEGEHVVYRRFEGRAAVARMPERTVQAICAALDRPLQRDTRAYLLLIATVHAEQLIAADRGQSGAERAATLRELDNAVLFADLLEAVASARPDGDSWRRRANMLSEGLFDVREAASALGDARFAEHRDWLLARPDEQDEMRARLLVAMLPGVRVTSQTLPYVRANLHRVDRLAAAACQRGTLDPDVLAAVMDAMPPLAEGAL